jgi:hypothetical protein
MFGALFEALGEVSQVIHLCADLGRAVARIAAQDVDPVRDLEHCGGQEVIRRVALPVGARRSRLVDVGDELRERKDQRQRVERRDGGSILP